MPLKRLLHLFVDILLLRAGPQDVPASFALFMLALLASAVTSLLLALESFSGREAILRVTVELGLSALLLAALLAFHGHRARFVQSFTAVCGTGALLALVAWPLFGIALARPAEDGLAVLALLLLWLLFAWSILVVGHILRNALEFGWFRSLMLALAYALLIAALGEWALPSPEVR